MSESVLIVGAGIGLSAAIARRCYKAGMNVTLAARNLNKIQGVAEETNAELIMCDSCEERQVINLFEKQDSLNRSLDLVVYNPSARVPGSITEVNIEKAKRALDITCYGAFLVAQQASRRMIKQGYGSIFFTGASASVKGFANSSVFAMGKFGLRGLAQSLARELHPKNIHIGHFIIDGVIGKSSKQDETLHPDEIAETYLQFHKQHRSAWSWELELRPWVEKF